ncbi:hypothetical protein ANN_03676 [Periplaneta americana]|uniref:Endonuclease-reverse transcriptase n=1 Tax=Periplaneta americana TaxID=6978 RepID=A0ABQ8TZK8_PERAM|nr:hypothetical protein ANN_03676 [Periplaneta americana]
MRVTSVPQVNTCKYLGIYLSNKLGWEEQIINSTKKASKALHFSMRILKKSNRRSNELAYKTLVRPIMEYGAVGWDPYRRNQIDSIEKVQRRAAKYVKVGKRHGEEIVKDLGWEFLESRRRKTRLTALFKAQTGHKAWTDINARLVTPSYLGREEQRLRVFENKVLRKILGAKRDEVTGEWRKLHNAELHALFSSPDIIRNIKSRHLRLAGHVARMGESKNAYRVLIGRPERGRPLGRPRCRWEDNIKMDMREVGYDDRDWINLAQDRDRWRTYVRAAMNLRVP